jgi:hypothetical protein
MESGPPLLLYSLTEFRELLLEVLALTGARDVVEVGSEAGAFTRELAAWARESGGTLTCVEPSATDELRRWHAAGALRLVEARSPAALHALAAADVYLLDGDHNYATVRGELEAIDARCFAAAKDALVVLHDVGWPCARRDFYYDPAALAPDAVHPHSFERGVAPGVPGLVDGGFRSNGAFAIAEREGLPRSGVLTAIEDFLSGREDLDFVSCPLVFGIGFLLRRAAPWAGVVESALRPYTRQPLLDRLEQNRIALYLRVLDDQDRRARELGVLQAERERRAAAEARLAAIESSLAHRIAGRLRALKERLAPRGSLRRQACDVAISRVKIADVE